MVGEKLDLVLSKLAGVRKTGEGSWVACCPAHEDKTPSLSVTEKEGNVVFHCFAGCEPAAIVKSMGLEWKHFFKEPPAGLNGTGGDKARRKYEPRLLPAGQYVCRIAGWKEKESKDADGNFLLSARWSMAAGPLKGVPVWDRFSTASDVGRSRLRTLLRAVGFVLPDSGPVDIAESALIGRFCEVNVEARTFGDRSENGVAFDGYRQAEHLAYDYQNEVGELLFQVLRLPPKDFRQRRPNGHGGWIWDLDGVRIVPFRFPELVKEVRGRRVWIVEGEKDATTLQKLGLLSTCNPGGARKWKRIDPACLEALRGLDVVILPDKDLPGRMHAVEVAASLLPLASSVRVLELPGDGVKDVSDWAAGGGAASDLEELLRLSQDGSAYHPEGAVARLCGVRLDAKQLDAISNYASDVEEGPEGEREAYVAKSIQDVVSEVKIVCNGWPRRLGESLFMDNDGEIHFLENRHALFAFLKRNASVSWKEGADDQDTEFVSQPELFEALQSAARRVHEFLPHPIHPELPEIHVSSSAPKSEDTDGSFLRELMGRFNPATPGDEALIWALALTPFWGGPPGARPFFVITGVDGIGVQETGKTTLVDTLAAITGRAFRLRIEKSLSADSIAKQVVSDSAAGCRIMLFDNLAGAVEMGDLADIITAPMIVGRPAFSKQRVRGNYLTWTATAVSPELDEDLASRSYVVHLRAPKAGSTARFREEVDDFVAKHRARLMLDAVSILRGRGDFEKVTIDGSASSRFPAWDREVLACHEGAKEALECRASRADVVNSRNEDLAILLQYLAKKHQGLYEVNLSVQELAEAWTTATGRKTVVVWVGRKLRALMRSGQLTKGLSPKGAKHGSGWVFRPEEIDAD